MTELTQEERKILDSILEFIPPRDEFNIEDLHARKILAPKYYPRIQVKDISITGEDENFWKERHSLRNICYKIEEYLLDKDFAERSKINNRLKLSDKGRALREGNSLTWYEGMDAKKKHAEENHDVLMEEYYQSQIDAHNLQIKSQVKLNELYENQIETNKISKITNIYIAIFTFIAAEYYCYEFLRDYISDINNNKKAIVNFSLLFLFLLGMVGYGKINRVNRK